MSLREQVGQLFMVGLPSTGPSAADEAVLRSSAAGSVVLLGNTSAGATAVARVTRQVRRVAERPAGVEVLVAADQEGGQVQRLRGPGFRRIPSAYEQAASANAALTRRATGWGAELRAVGVRADLAPVADLVPAELRDRNAPVGQLDRGYGADPDRLAEKTAAFVRGMDAAGVATAVKHFPGLGRVRGNTDFEADVVDRVTRRDDESWSGFRSAVRAGVDMVMLSSATYTRIDADHRAAFSATIMELLRRDLDFTGVIISDDLAARALDDLRPRARAVRFLRAGGDLAIVGDPRLLPAMTLAVAEEADERPEFAAQVTAKATRVVRMKAKRDLAEC